MTLSNGHLFYVNEETAVTEGGGAVKGGTVWSVSGGAAQGTAQEGGRPSFHFHCPPDQVRQVPLEQQLRMLGLM